MRPHLSMSLPFRHTLGYKKLVHNGIGIHYFSFICHIRNLYLPIAVLPIAQAETGDIEGLMTHRAPFNGENDDGLFHR